MDEYVFVLSALHPFGNGSVASANCMGTTVICIFVYFKKRKSELCVCVYAFSVFSMMEGDKWTSCLSAAFGSSSLQSVHCAVCMAFGCLLFSVLTCSYAIGIFLFLSASFFQPPGDTTRETARTMIEKIYVICANWIQLAYLHSADFAQVQLKPHLDEVLISLPIKSLYTKCSAREWEGERRKNEHRSYVECE